MNQENPAPPKPKAAKKATPKPGFFWRLFRFLLFLISFITFMAVLGAGAGLFIFYHFGKGLPDYRQLANYQPPITTRLHAGDGRLITEYATEKRLFVPIDVIPKHVIQAFLSAEDKNFYSHSGIDPTSIIRAVVVNLKNLKDHRRPVGASTITQQVAKNFLLTNEVSIERKIKEAILSFRIERAFDKQRILELYLNEIYLGIGSYGVAAAALNYFGKSLDDLTIAEAAYLAALPKAPNNYHPIRFPEAAKARRDWVIERLNEDGFINSGEVQLAKAEALWMRGRDEAAQVKGADYFAEEVRRELVKRYGEGALYKGGLSVRSSLSPALQEVADRVLRQGLIAYDKRHGYRGPLAKIELALVAGDDWSTRLARINRPPALVETNWELGVVLKTSEAAAEIGLIDKSHGQIPLAEMKWARPPLEEQKVGPPPKTPGDVLKPGDVIIVEVVDKNAEAKPYPKGTYALRQLPKIEGSLVAMNPHTGRVLAISGGFSYNKSQFNRATQATRQPGSAFKPFVYLPALEAGFTPSTLILDAPFVIDQGPGLPKWRPENYTNEFYGPSTMRLGLEKSRNLMTVRLAQTIGMDKVAVSAERFGIIRNLPQVLSMSLGAGETTLMQLTAAYGMLVNGGKKITPTLIDRVQDREGKTIFRHDNRPCPACLEAFENSPNMPEIPDEREQLVSAQSAYQMVAMLQGVIERGTGRIIFEVGKPLSGKTGTSNDSKDAWFVGFSPDLVVGVFMGFDEPATLGPKETGGAVAAPVFRDFMKEALKNSPATPFRVPPGIRLVRVSAKTGLPAKPGDRDVILEAFKPDNLPGTTATVLQGSGSDEITPDDQSNNSENGSEINIPSAGGIY